MVDQSAIAWCDSSLSLWIGCTEVSPACHHCYARVIAERFKMVKWNAPPVRTADSSWAKIEQYQRGAKRWFAKHGRPRLVFINHMADFCDNQAQLAWQHQACARMEAAPDVVFQLVTKRPQNMRKIVPVHWLRPGGWPDNVWVLTTTENQEEFDRRVPHLMDIPAAVRGVSIEPLLDTVDTSWAFQLSVDRIGRHIEDLRPHKPLPKHIRPLEWGIIGGESGPHARPMPDSRVLFAITGIRHGKGAVFVKQLSQADHPKTFNKFDTFPRRMQLREFPKS